MKLISFLKKSGCFLIICGLFTVSNGVIACQPSVQCLQANISPEVPVLPLPSPSRQKFITDHLKYFQSGIGVHPVLHLPFESVNALGQVDSRTQPTLIGFYLQILSAAVKRDLFSSWLTRSAAITEINVVLDKLLFLQGAYGWNGLIPWMYLDPFVPSSNSIGFVDNVNLSQSVAVLIGALESSSNFTLKESLLQKANQFLNSQQTGYELFYSAQAGKFHGSYDLGTHQFHPTYYIDRFMSEFRAATAFVILRFGISTVAWDSLAMTYGTYQLESGETVHNLIPYDGSGFQVFWPSMVANELAIDAMHPVLNNYLHTQLDFSKRNKIAGMVSACLVPEGIYYGKAGIPSAAETVDPLLVDVGSVYALAAAYNINPDSIIDWLESIKDQAPGFYGSLGFFDSARTSADVSSTYLGIDQASVVLGLLAKSGNYFDTYLTNRSLLNSFRSLYESKLIPIIPVESELSNPPNLWTEAITAFQNSYTEGTLNNFQNPVSNPHGITFNYQNVAASSWGGHFWLLNATDVRLKSLVVSISSRITPGDIKVELKSGNTIVYSQIVNVPATNALSVFQVVMPSTTNFAAITQLSVIVEPWRTGIRTANFTIHQLGFYTD